jgi:hypothetical protein
MATRRIRIDGSGETHIDTDTSIRDALKEAGITNIPPSVITGGEIITTRDFNRPLPAYDMLTIQTDLEKGATLRDRLLDQELVLIATRFLGEFPGRERSLELDDNSLIIRFFPLSNDYSPDYIDLLFVICGYPEVPPAGVHIPAKSPNRQQIRDRLEGHVLANSTIVLNHTPERYRKYVEELAKQGWEWVCFHFKGWSWEHPVSPATIMQGDCLYKYVEATFAALSSGYRH